MNSENIPNNYKYDTECLFNREERISIYISGTFETQTAERDGTRWLVCILFVFPPGLPLLDPSSTKVHLLQTPGTETGGISRHISCSVNYKGPG